MSEPIGYSSAVQPAVPIFEVAFKKGMWWSIPADMSQRMYENYKNNEDVGYTWDWGNSRYGSWAPEGERTSINRYVIDFNTWEQRNLDNDRRRSVRLVWVPADKVNPIWTGEMAGLLEDKALQDEVFGVESELIDGSDMAPAVKAMKGKPS